MGATRTIVALTLALSACSSNSTNEPTAGTTCSSRSGNYLAHFVERAGGTCGAVPDTSTPAGQAPPECQGTATPSSDNCRVEVNYTCSMTDGGSLTQTGTVHWSVDGSSGTAVYTMNWKPKSGLACSSMYDVTFTKT